MERWFPVSERSIASSSSPFGVATGHSRQKTLVQCIGMGIRREKYVKIDMSGIQDFFAVWTILAGGKAEP
jgi:hypothetical protein